MSLLYIDGFDSYDYLGYAWDGAHVSSMFTIASGIGRNGGSALLIQSFLWKQTYSSGYTSSDYRMDTYQAIVWYGLSRKIPETNDIIVGCAIRTNLEDTGYLSLELRKGETIQSKIRYRMEEVTVSDASNSVLGTSDNRDIMDRKIMYHKEWNYVEVYVSFSTTGSGVVTIRANEYTVFSGTGLDTAVDSNSIDNVRFYLDQNVAANPTTEFLRLDDLYIANSSGTINNNFLGNVNVKDIYPYQDTTYSGFTLASGTASGTAHYTQVTNKQQDNVVEHEHVYWINAATDDGDYRWGNVYNFVEIGNNKKAVSWFRFTGVNIPRKAKINSAYLFLRRYQDNASTLHYLCVYAQYIGRSPPLYNKADPEAVLALGTGYDAGGRTKIYRYHTYNDSGTPLGWRMELDHLLQLLVDRDDWVETNNSFTIIIYDKYRGSSNYYRRVYSWESDEAAGRLEEGGYRANITINFEVPYDKSTYLHTTSTGVADTFKYDTTGVSGTVYGLQHNMFTSHSDSLYYNRLLHEELMVVSGTSYSGSVSYTDDGLGADVTPTYTIHEVNPETIEPWTQQTISGAAFGITTISGYLGNTDFDHYN